MKPLTIKITYSEQKIIYNVLAKAAENHISTSKADVARLGLSLLDKLPEKEILELIKKG